MRALGTPVALLLALLGVPALASPALAGGPPVPPTPRNLPRGIEGLAPLDEQRVCLPAPQPGVAAFEQLLARTYPDVPSEGIMRDCGTPGVSEHKEGRAYDWGANVSSPRQAAEAHLLLGWLLSTDRAGHQAAMARRLGVMYAIYDRRIWGSYRAGAGWRAYAGVDPHTSHVHFSFSWAGARADTSYWSGRVAGNESGPAGPPPAAGPGQQPVLRVGDGGPAVAALQAALHVGADGRFGPATLAAVIGFQRARGLAPDGIVGSRTWAALGGSVTAPAPPPASSPVGHPLLRLGDTGAAVAALQAVLGITADGRFGPRTFFAVTAFQRAHGLAPDGVVGPRTWGAVGR